MSLYAIGDLHLSSNDSYGPETYTGYENWREKIADNWRRTIKSGDTVVLAGDTSFAKNLEEALGDFAFLDDLPGEKILIRGNHDSYFSTLTKLNNFVASNGFSSLHFLRNNHFSVGNAAVCGTKGYDISLEDSENEKFALREHIRLTMSLESAQKSGLAPIVFFHYPPALQFKIDTDALAIMKKFGVKKCFYGHLHGAGAKTGFVGEKLGIDFGIISADITDFIPKFAN
jgi:predicted phosphohydrolase